MHGKASVSPSGAQPRQRETKLLASASTIGAIWRIWLNGNGSQMWACSSTLVPRANFRRWAKTCQPFSAVCGPKFTTFGGMQTDEFFLVVDIMFRCRYIFGQSSKSVPKKRFCPQPVGETPGGLRTNFLK